MKTPRRRRSWLVAALGAVALGAVWPAAARCDEPEPKELFAGYSLARLADVDRHGASLALGLGLPGPLAGFVDASAHWSGSGGVHRDDVQLMAGPGVRLRRGSTVLFVRALGGLVRDTTSVSVLDVRVSESSTRLGALAGGGVDVRLGARWAARVEADYLWHDADEGVSRSGFRAAAGAVYRFGVAP